MKILYLSYERGLELTKHGHQIMHVDAETLADGISTTLNYQNKLEEIKVFKPELILEREFNDEKAIFNSFYSWAKKNLPYTKRVWWGIDTHIAYSRHKEYAKNFDKVFYAVSKYAQELGGLWLPLCYPGRTDSIVPNYSPVKFDISFVGRWNPEWFPERTAFINGLREVYGDKFHAVTDYLNMFSIIRHSKVSVNYAIKDDLNFRVFEVLGLGTELVTNDVPDLHKIEGLISRLIAFDGFQGATLGIDGILSNSVGFTHNTFANQLWIRKHHTLLNRHLAILEMLRTGEQLSF